MTDQSGSSCPGFQAHHPLVQSGVVALKFLDPPVKFGIRDPDHALHLLELPRDLFSEID